MLRVIGANPAMDRISVWPPLELGRVNRAASVSVVPGGKGFNVARAVVRLGSQAAAYGFLGGQVGEALRQMITADGVADRHTTIADGTRVCFIVVEPDLARATVLNEPGPLVSTDEVDRLLATVQDDCQTDDLVVLSGSLPDSVHPAVAGTIVAVGTAAGARVVVDIHGPALRAALDTRPWMVKCNRRELMELLGRPADGSVEDVAAAMAEVRTRGVEVVVVTLGAAGALVTDDAGVLRARAPEIVEVNATGSGDLLLAGLLVGLERGQSAREAIVLGIACGAAGATHLPPELPPGFDGEGWCARVTTEPM